MLHFITGFKNLFKVHCLLKLLSIAGFQNTPPDTKTNFFGLAVFPPQDTNNRFYGKNYNLESTHSALFKYSSMS